LTWDFHICKPDKKADELIKSPPSVKCHMDLKEFKIFDLILFLWIFETFFMFGIETISLGNQLLASCFGNDISISGYCDNMRKNI